MNPQTAIQNEAIIRRKHKYKPGGRDGAFLLTGAEMHHAPAVQRAAGYARLKRAIDVVVAAGMLVAALPILLLAGLLVRITSKGPAIYVQTRLGRGGLPFRIFKIRTMFNNCESLTGPRWSVPGDPRITFVGRILRATHVDELPQLWNVIRGDMSLIGPRPERPEIIGTLENELQDYRDRHAVRPGITGLAQVQLPPDVDIANVADKLVLDKAYIHHLSPRLDLNILICTACHVFGLRPRRYRFLLRHVIPADFATGESIHRHTKRRKTG